MSHNHIPVCDHIGLFTNDPERLLDFYTRIMEFDKISDSILDKSIMKSIFGINIKCRFIKLSKGELMLEIFTPIEQKSQVQTKIGINHFGYKQNNKIKFVQRLKEQGQNLITIKKNNHSIYFIKDPDGNLIELRE